MNTSSPSLSVVVVFYNMRREAARTLHSLSRSYQRGVDDLDYEVIALDNGSSEPLDEGMVLAHGPEFSYHRLDQTSRSPVGAMNHGARLARAEHLMLCIDGARILSPGALRESVRATRCHTKPVVATLSWHIGPAPQDQAVRAGYDREFEDRLLAEHDWQTDGYRLFECSTAGYSSAAGWFRPIHESNALTVSRAFYEELGGYDEGFQSPGGGLANLDLFRRACEAPGSQLVIVLGEGSFHQLHGGASTNAPREDSPWQAFSREYESLRGYSYRAPDVAPLYSGTLPPTTLPFLRESAEKTLSAEPAPGGLLRRIAGCWQRLSRR